MRLSTSGKKGSLIGLRVSSVATVNSSAVRGTPFGRHGDSYQFSSFGNTRTRRISDALPDLPYGACVGSLDARRPVRLAGEQGSHALAFQAQSSAMLRDSV